MDERYLKPQPTACQNTLHEKWLHLVLRCRSDPLECCILSGSKLARREVPSSHRSVALKDSKKRDGTVQVYVLKAYNGLNHAQVTLGSYGVPTADHACRVLRLCALVWDQLTNAGVKPVRAKVLLERFKRRAIASARTVLPVVQSAAFPHAQFREAPQPESAQCQKSPPQAEVMAPGGQLPCVTNLVGGQLPCVTNLVGGQLPCVTDLVGDGIDWPLHLVGEPDNICENSTRPSLWKSDLAGKVLLSNWMNSLTRVRSEQTPSKKTHPAPEGRGGPSHRETASDSGSSYYSDSDTGGADTLLEDKKTQDQKTPSKETHRETDSGSSYYSDSDTGGADTLLEDKKTQDQKTPSKETHRETDSGSSYYSDSDTGGADTLLEDKKSPSKETRRKTASDSGSSSYSDRSSDSSGRVDPLLLEDTIRDLQHNPAVPDVIMNGSSSDRRAFTLRRKYALDKPEEDPNKRPKRIRTDSPIRAPAWLDAIWCCLETMIFPEHAAWVSSGLSDLPLAVIRERVQRVVFLLTEVGAPPQAVARCLASLHGVCHANGSVRKTYLTAEDLGRALEALGGTLLEEWRSRGDAKSRWRSPFTSCRTPSARTKDPFSWVNQPTVLYEDDHVFVLNKPAGWLCDTPDSFQELEAWAPSGRHHGQLASWLKAKLGGAYSACDTYEQCYRRTQNGMCHRLDVHTSGAFLVAKTGAALTNLLAALEQHRWQKIYLCLVHGRPPASDGTQTLFHQSRRHPAHHRAQTTADTRDRSHTEAGTIYWKALNTYEVHGNVYTLMQVNIREGHRHMVRLHMLRLLGNSIVSDHFYSPSRQQLRRDEAEMCPRIFLHAHRVRVSLEGGEDISVKAPLAADLESCLQKVEEAGRCARFQLNAKVELVPRYRRPVKLVPNPRYRRSSERPPTRTVIIKGRRQSSRAATRATTAGCRASSLQQR